MILSDALRAVPRRLSRPGILALILGMYLFRYLIVMARQAPPLPGHPALNLLVAWISNLSPFHPVPFTETGVLVHTLSIAYLFGFSALAWQWTGDERRMAELPRGLAQAFGIYFVCGLPQVFLHPFLPPVLRLVPESVSRLGLLSILFMRTGLPILVGYLLAAVEGAQAEKAEALAQAQDARWSLLKAQLSPHVLLNSLTALAELVRVDPKAAQAGMKDLAEVYRTLLRYEHALKVPLAGERELLGQYLRMEQLRLGEKLRVAWDWDEALDRCLGLPLLLQPLVENALKFGPGADPQGGELRIQGRRLDGQLCFTVANTVSPHPARPGTGFGLRNLKARLELAYGPKAALTLRWEPDWTYAELVLPEESP